MGHEAKQAFEKVQYGISPILSAGLKDLLETKHLYQHLSIEEKDEFRALLTHKFYLTGEKEAFSQAVNSCLYQQFNLGTQSPTAPTLEAPYFVVGNVKLYCPTCEEREAFRPTDMHDITSEIREQPIEFNIKYPRYFQLLYLVFQCQVCEGEPCVFLVKRDWLTLSIEGRSPIEHIEIEKSIPKPEQKWFRDGVIAYQTGKVLAGLFYLRTFIEQFARRLTGILGDKKTGDEILTAYAGLLPDNLRDSMPSLREWYDKLSEAIHNAREDAELFETAREKIEEHFDIRRVHKLDSKVEKNTTKETPKAAK